MSQGRGRPRSLGTSPRLCKKVGVERRQQKGPGAYDEKHQAEHEVSLERKKSNREEVNDQASVEPEKQTPRNRRGRVHGNEREKIDNERDENARSHDGPERFEIDGKANRLPRERRQESGQLELRDLTTIRQSYRELSADGGLDAQDADTLVEAIHDMVMDRTRPRTF